MFQWFTNWQRARQRAIDIKILWPVMLQRGGSFGHTMAAFTYHTFTNDAWTGLDAEKRKQILAGLRNSDTDINRGKPHNKEH